MLSPDVPEFIPKSYQTGGTVSKSSQLLQGLQQATEVKARHHSPEPHNTPPPYHTPQSHHTPQPQLNVRHEKATDPRRSPLEEGEKRSKLQSGGNKATTTCLRAESSSDSPGVWRKTIASNTNQDEEDNKNQSIACESKEQKDAETKQPKPSPQKGRGKLRKSTSEFLETNFRRSAPAPSNNSLSYTKILQRTNDESRSPESKSSLSFSLDNQWPALGDARPQTVTWGKKVSAATEAENRNIAWSGNSNDIAPPTSPTRHKENGSHPEKPKHKRSSLQTSNGATNVWSGSSIDRPLSSTCTHHHENHSEKTWQERSSVHSVRDVAAVKNESSLEISKETSGTGVKTRDPNASKDKKTRPLQTGSNRISESLELSRNNGNKVLDNEDRSSISEKSHATSKSYKENDEVQKQQENIQNTSTDIIQENSELFQWHVKEKKKKVKMPKLDDQVGGSPRHTKTIPKDIKGKSWRAKSENTTSSVRPEQFQKGITPKKNYATEDSKNSKKSLLAPGKEEGLELRNTCRRDSPEGAGSGGKEKNSRPTKAIYTQKKILYTAKSRMVKHEAETVGVEGTELMAVRPLDEKAMQKKLIAQKKVKEEKRRKRELKAREAQSQSKDSRVSFITRDFLEKTFTDSSLVQSSSLDLTSMALTSEEYPSLKNAFRSVPHNRGTAQMSTVQTNTAFPTQPFSRPEKIHRHSPSSSVKHSITKSDKHAPDTFSAAQEGVTSYRGMLLKEGREATPEEAQSSDLYTPTLEDNSPKKAVKTRDPIEVDLMTIALLSKKKKKKVESVKEFSPRKDRGAAAVAAREKGATVAARERGATVATKRGIVNEHKTARKKLSPLKKCKIEMRRKELQALQSLLRKASLARQHLASLETPLSTIISEEISNKEIEEEKSTGGLLAAALKRESSTDENDSKQEVEPSASSKCNDCDSIDTIDKESLGRVSESVLLDAKDDEKKNEPETQNKLVAKVVTPESLVVQDKENLAPTQATNSRKVKESITEELTSKQTSSQGAEDDAKLSNHINTDLHKDPEAAQVMSVLVQEAQPNSSSVRKGLAREYCHQIITPEVNEVAKELMKSLVAFQERSFQRDPTKARIKRRYVCGLKETTKLMGKMSCVIVAPNIQQCSGPGALDDVVGKMLRQAESHGVPVVFALSTKMLKKLSHKKTDYVSCFGIINYQGAQDSFHRLMQLLPEAQKKYQQLVDCGRVMLPREEEEYAPDSATQPITDKNVQEEVIRNTTAIIMSTLQ